MWRSSIIGHKGLYLQAQDPPGGGTPPPKDPPATPPQNADAMPASWEEIFKHPRFKELNEAKSKAEQRLAEIEAKEKEQTEAALKKNNEWKELYEGTQNDLKKERATNLRLKVAASKGLPAEMVDRLRGETEAELNTDADSLLALMKPTEPRKGVPPIGSGGKPITIDLTTETDPAKIREAIKSGAFRQ